MTQSPDDISGDIIDDAEGLVLGSDGERDTAASRGSIARRMLLGAAGWSLLILVVTGWSLGLFYRSETETRLDEGLGATILTLANAVDSDSDGNLVYQDAGLPNDERFKRAYSGAYWAFVRLDSEGRVMRSDRSRSFFDAQPTISADVIHGALEQPDAVRFADGVGPDGGPVRYGVRALKLPMRANPVLLYSGIDRTVADEAVSRFVWRLGLALGVLAIGLVGGILVLIRYGLAPLREIRGKLMEVRSGDSEQLRGVYPEELSPLVGEINTLISHNREVVERARTQVGNLAHALKTPLAVLLNEAQGGDDRMSDLVRRQTEAMRANVDNYLKRAQAAAQAEVLGARADVKDAVEGISRMLERLHRDKDLAIDVTCVGNVTFRGERGDLDELVGNLLENAGKWCKSQVDVNVRRVEDTIEIVVDDDGKGLAPELRAEAVQRGKRLDETAPGTGLGLSIVTDLADIYGGQFFLEDSPLGGLRARLILPAAQSS